MDTLVVRGCVAAIALTLCDVHTRVALQSALEKQASSEWDAMINVNIKGVLNGMKAVLAGMKERESGTIVNVSSIAGIAVFDNHAVRCLRSGWRLGSAR